MTEETIFDDSSGNIFADLGLEDAEELFTRGKIGIQVIRLLKQRNLKQRDISELLGIAQPEVSHLMKGEFQRFSEGKLLTFLRRLVVAYQVKGVNVHDARLVADIGEIV